MSASHLLVQPVTPAPLSGGGVEIIRQIKWRDLHNPPSQHNINRRG